MTEIPNTYAKASVFDAEFIANHYLSVKAENQL